ncbi:hypothetical protein HDV00_000923 [Rhizophlyctis rosea]|nr:hypothetical protein HDV00_000923 [Rhizophlyctis rosea]
MAAQLGLVASKLGSPAGRGKSPGKPLPPPQLLPFFNVLDLGSEPCAFDVVNLFKEQLTLAQEKVKGKESYIEAERLAERAEVARREFQEREEERKLNRSGEGGSNSGADAPSKLGELSKKDAKKEKKQRKKAAKKLEQAGVSGAEDFEDVFATLDAQARLAWVKDRKVMIDLFIIVLTDIETALNQLEDNDEDRNDSGQYVLPWNKRSPTNATYRLLCHYANLELRRARDNLAMLDHEELSLKTRIDQAHETLSDVARKKFRTLAIRLHPDKLNRMPTDEEYNLLLEIQTAYQVLTDPELRRQYIQMNNHSMFLAALPKLSRDKEQENKLMQYRKKAGIKRAATENQGERRRLTGGIPHKCTVPQIIATEILNHKTGEQKVHLQWSCASAIEMQVTWYELQMTTSTDNDAITWVDIFRGANTIAWTPNLPPGHYSFRVRGKNNIAYGEWSHGADLFVEDFAVTRLERREQAEKSREARRARFVLRVREQAEAIVEQTGNVPTTERLARLGTLVDHLKRNRCFDVVAEVETMAAALKAKIVKSEEQNRWRSKLNEFTKAVLQEGGEGKVPQEDSGQEDDEALMEDLHDDDELGDQDGQADKPTVKKPEEASSREKALSDFEAFILDLNTRYPQNTPLALPPSTRNQIVQAIKALIRQRPLLSLTVDYLEPDADKAVTVKNMDVYKRIMALVEATKARAGYLGGQAKTGDLAQHVVEKMVADCEAMEKARAKKAAEVQEKRIKREEERKRIEEAAKEREMVAAFARGEVIKKEAKKEVKGRRGKNVPSSQPVTRSQEESETVQPAKPPAAEPKAVVPSPPSASVAPAVQQNGHASRNVTFTSGATSNDRTPENSATSSRAASPTKAWSIKRVTPRKKKSRNNVLRSPVPAPIYDDEYPSMPAETLPKNVVEHESISPAATVPTTVAPYSAVVQPSHLDKAQQHHTADAPASVVAEKPSRKSVQTTSKPQGPPNVPATGSRLTPMQLPSSSLGTPPPSPGNTPPNDPADYSEAAPPSQPSNLQVETHANQQPQTTSYYPTFGSFPKSYEKTDAFLASLDLSQYLAVFHAHDIMYDDLPLLTEEDLTNLGVTKLGPRRRLWAAVQELKKQKEGIQKGVAKPATIGQWLNSLDMEECEQNFHEQEITLADLVMLTEDDLNGLVKKVGHKRRIREAIDKLRNEGAGALVATPVSETASTAVGTPATTQSNGVEHAQPTTQPVPVQYQPVYAHQQPPHVQGPYPAAAYPAQYIQAGWLYGQPWPPTLPAGYPAPYQYAIPTPVPDQQPHTPPHVPMYNQSPQGKPGNPNRRSSHSQYGYGHHNPGHQQQQPHGHQKAKQGHGSPAVSTAEKGIAAAAPAHFLCTLTHEVMENPVRGPDGLVYEESHIRVYLAHTKTWRSPVTQVVYPPNEWERCIGQVDYVLRGVIQNWRAQNGSVAAPSVASAANGVSAGSVAAPGGMNPPGLGQPTGVTVTVGGGAVGGGLGLTSGHVWSATITSGSVSSTGSAGSGASGAGNKLGERRLSATKAIQPPGGGVGSQGSKLNAHAPAFSTGLWGGGGDLVGEAGASVGAGAGGAGAVGQGLRLGPEISEGWGSAVRGGSIG